MFFFKFNITEIVYLKVTPSECGVADLMIEGGYPQGADSNLGPPSITSHVSQIQEVGFYLDYLFKLF